MRSIRGLALAIVVASAFIMSCTAQVLTGAPPFGSYRGSPDVVNMGNLNVYWNFPIINKAGRGTNFTWNLEYDSSVWYPVTANGTTSWQPVANWGWQGLTPSTNAVASYNVSYSSGTCGQYGNYTWQSWSYSNIQFTDQYGVMHPFSGGGSYIDSPSGSNQCPPNGSQPSTPQTVAATDGSGMRVTWLPEDGGQLSLTFYTSNGTTINAPTVQNPPPPTQAYTYSTDSNGNEISYNGSGGFTDTLGTTALSIVTTPNANAKLWYTNPSNGQSAYTVNYQPYNIKTAFGCSGITEYTSSGQVYLVSSIQLPDGRSYQFSYEPTPNNSGYVTGRVASVTLPTGGQISYTYTGGNHGVECQDGSTAGMTRTTPDGSWSYSRSGSGTQWTTTVTDPAQNQTVIAFLSTPANYGPPVYFYEISRKAYTGSSGSGTLAQTILTCYQMSSDCDPNLGDNNTSLWGNGAVAWRQVTVEIGGAANGTSKRIETYDGNGNRTEQDDYDVGSGGPGPLIRKTLITYAQMQTVNIVNDPASVTVQDGSGNVASQSYYRYDETAVQPTSNTPQLASINSGYSRGNLTSLVQCSGSSCSSSATTSIAGAQLVSKFSYFDTGNVQTATDANGAGISYTYGGCGNSFPTAVNYPLNLSTSAAWNCNGGVQTSSADFNGNATIYTYNDTNYWFARQISDPWGNVTSETYPGAGASGNTSEVAMNFNGGAATSDILTQYDALGRVQLSQQRQGPGQLSFNISQTIYDSFGRVSKTTLPFPGSNGTTSSSYPGTSTSYDTLGRIYTVSDSGGGSATYAWSQNDDLITLGPAPTGENTKKRQLEYDGLGRLTSVCEVTGVSGAGTCSQVNQQTGYWTQYSYDGAGRLTQVIQNKQASGNQQTRSVTYDLLGRKTQEVLPETGTTTYTYDSDSTCGTYYGDLVKVTDAVGDVTCIAYDSLHRLLSAVVKSGNYSSHTPQTYYAYDAPAATPPATLSNTKGNLAEAYTCTSACTPTSNHATDIFFSTSAAGGGLITSQMWETTPNSGHYYMTQDIYYPNGTVQAISAQYNGATILGMPSMTYGVDGMGRMTSATDTAHSNQKVASAACYTSGGRVAGVKLGNGDSDAFGYDWNTMRPTSFQFNITGSSPFNIAGSLTWNANASLKSMNLTDTNDSSKNQNCTYSADDLQRLVTVSCGNAWAQTFSYDAFGNVSKNGTVSYAASYSAVTNQENNGYATYDANGNVTAKNFTGGVNWNYSWDAAGQPWSVNGITATYDALGRLVETNNGGGYTQYIYRPSGDKLGAFQAGALSQISVPLPGAMAAVYNQQSQGLAYIRHMDYLGSSRLATTWAHAIYSKESYAPFGETYNEAGTMDRVFTGQTQNTMSGVYDYMFRRYDPGAGRWLSPDPAGWAVVDQSVPQSMNRYAYVLNNPMNTVDPDGLACVYIDKSGNVSIDNSADNLAYTCAASGGTYVAGSLQMSDLYPTGDNGTYIFDNGGALMASFGVNGMGSTINSPIYQGQIQYTDPTLTYMSLNYYLQNSTVVGPFGPTDAAVGSGAAQYQVYQGVRILQVLGGFGLAGGKEYTCADTPVHNIRNWALEGLGKGAFFGALEGNGAPGATWIEGAVYGGGLGAVTGTGLGAVASGACGALGVY